MKRDPPLPPKSTDAGLGRGGRSSSRALTMQFRVQFLDASGTIIRGLHADETAASAR